MGVHSSHTEEIPSRWADSKGTLRECFALSTSASAQELIQNADDAGATEVQFLLDARPDAYGRETLINPGLARFQGPALYAQNDAVFKDSDWDSIQTLHRSVKEKDPMKVGRFGIGFNSVYHLTGSKTWQKVKMF